MESPSKIPVIFLLKKSREECGALKSYIQELEDTIKEKDKQIAKLQKHNKKLEALNKLTSPTLNVDRTLSSFLNRKNKTIPAIVDENKRNKRKIKLFNKMARTYNAWYEGCKVLITLMGDLKNNR
jgi:septal ring factor EnvC (AmiA/AmiB activator)